MNYFVHSRRDLFKPLSLTLFCLGLLLVSGCGQQATQLTPKGESLLWLPDPDAVHGCTSTGEVRTVALVGPENSYRLALIKTRNRAAEQGATHLTIDHAETRSLASTVKGRGFRCPFMKMKTLPSSGNRESWIIVE